MIKSARGVNLKSWEDLQLDFVPGINMLIGHTRAGKTNMYRGVKIINENKPSGLNYVSKWAVEKNKKGDIKIVDNFRFVLTLDNGTIERFRGPGGAKENLYIIDDKPLKAVGAGKPPEEVTNLLNMNEVNFGSQHGDPFLLRPDGTGGAEASRFLNGLIDFTDADDAIAKCDTLKRAAETEQKRLTSNLAEMKAKLDKFKNLEELQELVEDATDLEQNISELNDSLNALVGLKTRMQELNTKKSNLPNIIKIETLLCIIEKHEQEINTIRKKCGHLHEIKEKLSNYMLIKQKTKNNTKIGEILPKIEQYNLEIISSVKILKELPSLKQKLQQCIKIKNDTKDNERVGELLSNISSVSRGVNAHNGKMVELTRLSSVLKKCNTTKLALPKIENIQSLLLDVENLNKEIAIIETRSSALILLKNRLLMLHERKAAVMLEVTELETQIGNICPECNGTGRIV